MTIANIDLDHWVAQIPQHTLPLPPEADAPIRHYEYGSNTGYNLLRYFDNLEGRATVRPTVFEKHQRRLRSWVVVHLVEAFERCVKELAAVCVDHVGPLVLDGRLKVFSVDANQVAAHFSTGTLGRALAEAGTWLQAKQINTRFGRLLADHHTETLGIVLYPPNGEPARTLDTVFQIRHSIVHNVGMLTQSDGAKLGLLTRQAVAGGTMLAPRNGDIWYVKLFLDQEATRINTAVAARLSVLLTDLHTDNPTGFVAATKAGEMAAAFQQVITIATETQHP